MNDIESPTSIIKFHNIKKVDVIFILQVGFADLN